MRKNMNKTSITERLTEGENLFACGRTEEAKKLFLAVLREHGPSKEASNDLGVIAYQRKDFERAREYFMEAIRIDPLYQDALDNFLMLRQSPQGDFSFQQEGTHELEEGTLFTTSSHPGCDNKEWASPSDSLHHLDPHLPLVSDRKTFVVEFCRGKNVLHIGCVGSGSVEERLKDRSHLHYRIGLVAKSLIGLDINKVGLASLRDAGYESCLFADVETDGIDPQWVMDTDVIVIPEVLEHLSNPGRFLTHLKNLAFKGDILISVPNALSFRTCSYANNFNIEFVHPDHNYYFSPVTLQTLLTKHGFSITDATMYYWPSEDTFGREFDAVLDRNTCLAEGIIAVARDIRYVSVPKGPSRVNPQDGKPISDPGNIPRNKTGFQLDRHADSHIKSTASSLKSPIPWKLYYSPGVAHHGESARKMLGLERYIPSLHYNEPVWFFGMYFDQDFFQVMAHQGRKIINWRGSDALKLDNAPQRIQIIQQTNALHVCQSERQQAILKKQGIKSIVRPMLNAQPVEFRVKPFPTRKTEILVFWRRGIDDFIQSDLFFAIAAGCPDVIFHIVGDEDSEKFNQPGQENIIFHGFLDEETLHRLMDQCKGTIRPWISDGTPNIQTKMLLKGKYAAHSCKFEKVAHCRTVNEYVEWIQWLKTVTAPNTEAREWWLRNLNRFDFLNLDFTPEGGNEISH